MEMIRNNPIDCVKYFMLLQGWKKGKDEPNIVFFCVEIVTYITTQNSERKYTFIVKLGMNRQPRQQHLTAYWTPWEYG